MTLQFNKRERAILAACAFNGALFVSIIMMWWTVLSGGNPLTYKTTELLDGTGHITKELRVGEAAGVRRYLCSDKNVGIEFFPTLRDKDGLLFPLPSGMVEAENKCTTKTYGFVVPDIPAGEYTYQSTLRFQANLVGRDEMATSPPITVRIVR